MPLWGGSAATQAAPVTDPTTSVTTDANESVSRSDLDAIQANFDSLSASVGSPTDPAASTGNVYERLNFLDQRLSQNVGNDLDDVNTILDVNGTSILIAATSTNRYANAFLTGEDRTNIAGTVENSIHNSNPVTVREALLDLDAATTNARVSLFGSATGAFSASVATAGTGYALNELVSSASGSLTVKVVRLSGSNGAIAEVVVVSSGSGYAVNDAVPLSQAAAGGASATLQVTSLVGLRRTDADLGTMECSIVQDGSSVRSALRQLDVEAASARDDIGELQSLSGFDNNNGDVVSALNELRNELGDVTTLTTTDKTDTVAAINEVQAEIGDITTLTTTDKTDTVSAINEVQAEIGDITTLTTTVKSDAVSAINEVQAEIGDITSLSTTDQSDAVAAINEVLANVGDLTTLTTTAQASAVSAINEVQSAAEANETAIGTLSELHTSSKGSLVAASNEIFERLNMDGTSETTMALVLSEADDASGNGYAAGRAISGGDAYLKLIGAPPGATLQWISPSTAPSYVSEGSWPASSADSEAAGLKYPSDSAIAHAMTAKLYKLTEVSSSEAGVYQAVATVNSVVIAVSNRLSLPVFATEPNVTMKTPTTMDHDDEGVSAFASSALSDADGAYNAMLDGYGETDVFDEFELPVVISMTEEGTGYTSVPTVTFGGYSVDPQVSTALTAGGGVSLTLIDRGAEGVPVSITIDPPSGGGGVQAEAIVEMQGNSVGNIIVTNAGSGYSAVNPPSVTFANLSVAATVTVTVGGVGLNDTVQSITVIDGGKRYSVSISASDTGGTDATADLVASESTLHHWSSQNLFHSSAPLRSHGPSSMRCEWMAFKSDSAFVAAAYEVCWLFNNYSGHSFPENAPQSVILYGSNSASLPFEQSGALVTDTSFVATGTSWAVLDARRNVAGRMRFYLPDNATSYAYYLLAVTRTVPDYGDSSVSSVKVSSFRVYE